MRINADQCGSMHQSMNGWMYACSLPGKRRVVYRERHVCVCSRACVGGALTVSIFKRALVPFSAAVLGGGGLVSWGLGVVGVAVFVRLEMR